MRLRFFLAFTLVALVSIASVLLIASQRAASEVRTFMRGSVTGLDRLAGDLSTYYEQNQSWDGVEALLQAGMGGMMGGGGPRLTLSDAQGRVIAVSRGEGRTRLSAAERALSTQVLDRQGNVIAYLLVEGGQGNPAAESALISRLTQAGFIAAGISLVLALLVASLFSYSLLKPIQEITRAAQLMSAGDLGQRVRETGRDEVGILGKAFNQMAANLQKAEENRRAMTADIAHELRTPIAIQRAHLEALQDGIYPLTVENLTPVLEQTELLARLVDDLRTLALADAGELHLDCSPLFLPTLVQRTADRFRPEADQRRIRLTVQAEADRLESVSLDAGRMEQILNNLISNALRHTPEGGEILVSLGQEDGWTELAIADNGPGIPPEALPRLFERFYRADSSRSRREGGTGLGLAIARQLTLAHGGEITAQNRPEGGAVFRLRFPVNNS